MAKPLTDDERAEIVELLERGLSCGAIAKQVGRSGDTVSRIARDVGHRFGRSNSLRAQEARSAYCAERRADIAAAATERAEQVLQRMEGPHRVFNFGGRDNTFNEEILDQPPVDAQRAMAQTIRDLMRTVIEIHRLDTKADEGVSDVDDWLRHQMGESVQVQT